MSVLSEAQKQALFGRLLGVPEQPPSASAPERARPTGTVAGTEPGVLANSFSALTGNTGVMLVVGIAGVLGLVWLARKVF